MSYEKATLSNSAPSIDRVERLLTEINNLSEIEFRFLKNKLIEPTNTPTPTHSIAALSHNKIVNSKRVNSLSQREVDVLTLVATGYSRKEIGATLEITSNTAAKHISSIYRKLNICSIAEATRIALENGVIASHKNLG